MPTTTNMRLALPTVSTTTGPQWATLLNTSFGVIDVHDHSSGKGVRVPSAGLNINADLGFGGYNAVNLRSLRLASQSGPLVVSTDLGCISNVSGDLYWNNGDGTAVQITDGVSVNAGAGSISGLPSGSASASFSTATFSWRSATNVAATMDVGPLVIRDTAASAPGITLASPSDIAAYSMYLPTSLPGSRQFLTLDETGSLVATIATSLGITRPMQAAVGQQVSSSCGATSTSSGSFGAITNLAVTLTTSGRPVRVMCVPDGSGSGSSQWQSRANAIGSSLADARLAITGSTTANFDWHFEWGARASGDYQSWSPSYVDMFLVLAAGTYTFTIQSKIGAGSTELRADYMKVVAWEL